jgi:hypothetical protein
MASQGNEEQGDGTCRGALSAPERVDLELRVECTVVIIDLLNLVDIRKQFRSFVCDNPFASHTYMSMRRLLAARQAGCAQRPAVVVAVSKGWSAVSAASL